MELKLFRVAAGPKAAPSVAAARINSQLVCTVNARGLANYRKKNIKKYIYIDRIKWLASPTFL